MTKPELCPVCNGNGNVVPVNDGTTTSVPSPVICHGCNGKGWVEVGSVLEMHPYLPQCPCQGYPVVTYFGSTTGR
jgi:DnaJ-class molecular chaperone